MVEVCPCAAVLLGWRLWDADVSESVHLFSAHKEQQEEQDAVSEGLGYRGAWFDWTRQMTHLETSLRKLLRRDTVNEL